MKCIRCHRIIDERAVFCQFCGKKQIPQRLGTRRPNGAGCVYKNKSGKYTAIVTLGYTVDDNGKLHRQTRSATFSQKKEALAALDGLKNAPAKLDKAFSDVYNAWLPTHKKQAGTLNCYKAAYKHFAAVHPLPFADIGIDELQECIDSCGNGVRTKQNMKALCSLLWKYAIPRGYTRTNVNLGHHLVINESGAAPDKPSFSPAQLEQIAAAVGSVPYADYILCMCYLGFRPAEFLALDMNSYNAKEKCFIGGGKTIAGTNRTVTISPKIQPIIDRLTQDKISGAVFCGENGKKIDEKIFRERFYAVLEQIGIENPITNGKHKFTPHSCRHTFATLMKRVEAPAKDKQALIGHSSEAMLKYYQDVDFDDLRKITNAI